MIVSCSHQKWMRVWMPDKGIILKCFFCEFEKPLDDIKLTINPETKEIEL